MAARRTLQSAPRVCGTCKLRKKRCDKALPHCGYCTRHSLDCQYTPSSPTPSRPPCRLSLLGDDRQQTWKEAIHAETYRLVRETGRFFDDVTVAYFEGIHGFLPIISREQFHRHLFLGGSTANGDFSLLLLVVALITYQPPCASPGSIDLQSLYFSAKSLFAQVEIFSLRSLHLIQAGLLLSVFEYAHHNSDLALVTLTTCARIAHVAGLDAGFSSTGFIQADSTAEVLERTNTWWGIVICERIFLCEAGNLTQPRMSPFPAESTPLPGGFTPVSATTAPDLDGFARSAQAAWLLDRVIDMISRPDNGTIPPAQLSDLDAQVQLFLGELMRQRDKSYNMYCAALALGIRGLFILHSNTINRPTDRAEDTSTPLPDHVTHRSNAAIRTATQMVIDIANSHRDLPDQQFNDLPPSCAYLMREALNHVTDEPGSRISRQLLQSTLDRTSQRWDMQWD